jgi:CheY-like chemotaxis protein
MSQTNNKNFSNLAILSLLILIVLGLFTYQERKYQNIHNAIKHRYSLELVEPSSSPQEHQLVIETQQKSLKFLELNHDLVSLFVFSSIILLIMSYKINQPKEEDEHNFEESSHQALHHETAIHLGQAQPHPNISNTGSQVADFVDLLDPQKEKLTQIKGKILLVEDDQNNQKIATRMCKRMGLTVDIANNGREAIEKLSLQHYDLVLMDIQMPNMDGLEATEIIRDNNSQVLNHHIPIIALTASSSTEDALRCLSGGMNDYLSKPIQRDHLQATISKALRVSASSPTLIGT